LTSKWPSIALSEVCVTITDGSHFSPAQSEEGYAYVTVRDLQDGEINLSGAKTISEQSFLELSKNGCAPQLGDVLFSKDGTVGKVALVSNSEPFVVLSSIAILRPNTKVLLPEFLAFVMQSPKFLADAIGKKTGTAIRRIVLKDLKRLTFYLPPLDEQKRIVAKLDEALDYVDESMSRVRASLIQCDCYLGAHLDSLLDFKDVPNKNFSLAKVTSKIGSGATPKGGHQSYKESGISLIRSMNVHDMRFKPDQLAFLDEEQAAQLNNVTVQDGDVLLNITGASVARTCVVPNEILPARVNQHVAIVRPIKEMLLSDFLAIQLVAPRNKHRLLGIGEESGSTRQALTKAMIENFIIQIPTEISHQRQILAAYDSVTSLINELRQNLLKQLSELESLRSSILFAAFAGDF
jgi:type I restriction enzyme S subunit